MGNKIKLQRVYFFSIKRKTGLEVTVSNEITKKRGLKIHFYCLFIKSFLSASCRSKTLDFLVCCMSIYNLLLPAPRRNAGAR